MARAAGLQGLGQDALGERGGELSDRAPGAGGREVRDSARISWASLRASYDTDTYEQVQDMYKTAPLLVIDDLGTEYRKSTGGGLSWAEEQLYQIVDYRYRERLETVVTSNTDMESLDERIADRLLDVGSGAVVTCNLVIPSYRSGKVLNG